MADYPTPTPSPKGGGWNSFRIVTFILLAFIFISVSVQGCVGLRLVSKMYGHEAPLENPEMDSTSVDSIAYDAGDSAVVSYDSSSDYNSYSSDADTSVDSSVVYYGAPELPD